MLKGARKVRLGERIAIKDRNQHDAYEAELLEKQSDGVCLLNVQTERSAEAVLDEVGFPPLPPYIRRDGDPTQARDDQQRYQTVYARAPGAVAAPTAGLHFTEALLSHVRQQGVRQACVTLHVGAGTFKPVAVEELEQHEIHREWFGLDAANAEIINTARAAGGRIVAVGTTATRVLETVATGARVEPGQGDTQLFITPGYQFKAVDAMITNFHLPKSTLLALVAAFAGLERTLAAYHHAIEQRYRFYSYGDAMLIV
jgi:S-adenosylmethionine:tRNA ribosyltransferase-isomerase